MPGPHVLLHVTTAPEGADAAALDAGVVLGLDVELERTRAVVCAPFAQLAVFVALGETVAAEMLVADDLGFAIGIGQCLECSVLDRDHAQVLPLQLQVATSLAVEVIDGDAVVFVHRAGHAQGVALDAFIRAQLGAAHDLGVLNLEIVDDVKRALRADGDTFAQATAVQETEGDAATGTIDAAVADVRRGVEGLAFGDHTAQDIQTEIGRKVQFDLANNEAAQSVYYCERGREGEYVEIGSEAFMQRIKNMKCRQVLFYLHGYSNLPEPDVYPRTEHLQSMCDAKKKDEVLVVPMVWPCDAGLGLVKKYYNDQIAADSSAVAYARVFGKFLDWREKNLEGEDPCLKRVNVLAHSMGNRVLRGAMSAAMRYFCPQGLPLVFRNTFLVAADVVNESLEPGQEGAAIPMTSRNVVVYYASDDLALRASKVANVANSVASRRLGHSGPEDMTKVPKNVFAVDCDDVNTDYDFPKGHSYFLDNGEKGAKRKPGKVFEHIWQTILTGRTPNLADASVRSLTL